MAPQDGIAILGATLSRASGATYEHLGDYTFAAAGSEMTVRGPDPGEVAGVTRRQASVGVPSGRAEIHATTAPRFRYCAHCKGVALKSGSVAFTSAPSSTKAFTASN